MKNKALGEIIGLIVGSILGMYWFITTRSYFLLILPIVGFCLVGYVLGNNLDNPI